MIEFKTDNPALEALAIQFFKQLLNSETTPIKAIQEAPEPVKLKPLPKVHSGVQDDLVGYPTFNPIVRDKLPYGMTQLTLPEPEPENVKKEKRTYQRKQNYDGFPIAWKKRALDKISARQAFTLRDIDERYNKNPQAATNLKKWLSDENKVTIERLMHIMGHPYLFIPTWEDNRGVTQFAKNALTLRSRMAQVAAGELNSDTLSREEVAEMERLGFNKQVKV